MKKGLLKKFALAAVLSAALAFTPVVAGCQSLKGRDGTNGKDLTIYDIWQETIERTGNPDLSFEDFLRDYLSYDSDELAQSSSLTASINRSLMSGVSIITSFSDHFGIETKYYGSGVIVDVDKMNGDMTVVTNCHVVYSAENRTNNTALISAASGFAKSVKLWLYGSEYAGGDAIDAKIIGASKSYDIAVLKVSGNTLVKNSHAVAAQWYSGEECFIGESVYTVGNADGKKLSASVGYISKDSEEITVNIGTDSIYENYTYRVLRTDTAINGGNSGGGLYNKYGELVGIVNAKSVSENIDNMGYALAAATTRRVVDRLIGDANGYFGIEVVSPGISFVSTDSYTTGLDKDGYARIKEVVTVSHAPITSTLRTGDILLSVAVKRSGVIVESMEVERMHNLTDALIAVRAGDSVTFTLDRGGQQVEATMSFSSGNFTRKA